ncbi:hypothetical protein EC973_001972 [Apophysomyces ossiformis]|uniref:DIS3-like exonuclease 2 n=1 Tax=Apophysomyces ossiformis TaxID=679940 RepID=A0A8H7BU67_9FUNG|nr:hypothetical protein EC973_001972 [Apophysomyces ossiformis]
MDSWSASCSYQYGQTGNVDADRHRNSHFHNQKTEHYTTSTGDVQNFNGDKPQLSAQQIPASDYSNMTSQFQVKSIAPDENETDFKDSGSQWHAYRKDTRATSASRPQGPFNSSSVTIEDGPVYQGKFGPYTIKSVLVRHDNRSVDVSIDDIAIVRTMLPQPTWQSHTESPFMYPQYLVDRNSDHALQNHSIGTETQTELQKRPSIASSAFRDGLQPRKYVHPYDRNPGNRRELFEAYISPNEMQRQIDSRQLHQGTLRINRRKRFEAYVTCDDLESDIFIFDHFARNRALEGDVVAVKLLENVDKIWSMRNKRVKKLGNNTESADPGPETASGDEEDEEDLTKPKYCGQVVGILHRRNGLCFAGTISVDKPQRKKVEQKEVENTDASKNEGEESDTEWEEGDLPPTEIKRFDVRTVWFKPIDKRVPLIVIPIEDAPPDLLDKESSYKDKLLVAKFMRWSIFSLSPFGKIIKVLGNVGSIAAETKAIITDCSVRDEPFSSLALQGLPSLPWSIPQGEYLKRRNCATELIFTIDPATAKDLDDAVHIKPLKDGNFEVGVHIADVTYFVKENTLLDTEASERGTSTYLVDKVLPMLPGTLSEELCSLHPGVDRLAFSVIWQMDPFGKVLDTWMGRTIINSRAKLSYEDAQSVIDGSGLPISANVISQKDIIDIEKSIVELFRISSHMRKRRFDEGALSMNSVKLTFQLNEKGDVDSVKAYELKEANRLIEEFMICANVTVARKIAKHYHNSALLRRHEAPVTKKLREFYSITEELGYDFDITSAGGFQASLNAIKDGDAKEVLLQLAIKPMRRAKYFCTGSVDISKYEHYALNEPLYTHFTSPIRRYADVIVHRQLSAALRNQASPFTKRSTQNHAIRCNYAKDAAKNAQDAHIMLYLAHYLHQVEQNSGPELQSALILYVLDNAIDIYVPIYGLERRVYMDILPLESFEFDVVSKSIVVVWKSGIKANRETEENLFTLRETQQSSGKQQENMVAEVGKIRPAEELSDDDLEDEDSGIILPKLSSAAIESEEIDYQKRTQRFKTFSRLKVSIQVNIFHSPPLIYMYPVNPFC